MARRKPCHFLCLVKPMTEWTDARPRVGFSCQRETRSSPTNPHDLQETWPGRPSVLMSIFFDQLRPCDQPAPNLINIDKLNPRPSSFHQLSPGFLPVSTSTQHVYLHTCKGVGSVGYNVLIRGGIRI
jgi:hypothetical protein